MRIALLLVGDELLDGRVVDVNGAALASWLGRVGARLSETCIVQDERAAIVRAVLDLAARHEAVFVAGGLGITRDDVTRQAVAECAGRDLVEVPEALETLRRFVAARGHAFSDDLRGHVLVPETATALANPAGLALGFVVRVASATVWVLPGVPGELLAILHEPDALRARSALLAGGQTWRQHLFTLWGATERDLERCLTGLVLPEQVRVGMCAQEGPLELSLGSAEHGLLSRAVEVVREHLVSWIVSEGRSIPEAVHDELIARGATLCTAESCTGGLIGNLVTDVPGSSGYFVEGFVTYSNDAKTRRLEVPAETLAAFGAVSAEVVAAMASCARRSSGATWAVASSGIAGPGGGTPEKPVGLVHLAVAGPGGVTVQQEVRYPGRTRQQVKRRAALAALVLLLRTVRSS